MVHEQGSAFVEWRDSAGQEETGGEGSAELKDETLKSEGSDEEHFALIVAGHFGGVKNHSSDDVGIETLVETSKTLGLHDFFGILSETSSLRVLIGHHLGLEDIEWVTGARSDSTSEGSGQELSKETSSWGAGTNEHLDWLVKTESEGGVRGLSQPGWTNTLVEGTWTLVRESTTDDATDSGILSISGSNLKSSLNDINWVDPSDSKDSSGTSTEDILEELGHGGVGSSWSNGGGCSSESWGWNAEHESGEDGSKSWDDHLFLFETLNGLVHVEHDLSEGAINGSLNWSSSLWGSSSEVISVDDGGLLFFLNMFNLKSDFFSLGNFSLRNSFNLRSDLGVLEGLGSHWGSSVGVVSDLLGVEALLGSHVDTFKIGSGVLGGSVHGSSISGGVETSEIGRGGLWLRLLKSSARIILSGHREVSGSDLSSWGVDSLWLGLHLSASEGGTGVEEGLVDSTDVRLDLGGLVKHDKHGFIF